MGLTISGSAEEVVGEEQVAPHLSNGGSIVDAHQIITSAGEDTVVELTGKVVLETEGIGRTGSSYVGRIVDLGIAERLTILDSGSGAVPAISLGAVVTEVGLDREEELVGSLMTFVDVEGFVLTVEGDQMTRIDRAAEPLEAVVGVGHHFHVVNGRSRSHAGHGETIDLLIRREFESTEADTDITEGSGVIRGVITSVEDVITSEVHCEPFHRVGVQVVGRGVVEVDGSVSEDDHTSPGTAISSIGITTDGIRLGGVDSVGSVNIDVVKKLSLSDAGEDDGIIDRSSASMAPV